MPPPKMPLRPQSIPNAVTEFALIAGAGRGLGRNLALALAARGDRLAINDLNPDRAAQTVLAIQAAGGHAKSYSGDIAKKVAVQVIANQIEDDGHAVQSVYNCARVLPKKNLLSMDEWEWRRTLDVNLTGAFILTQVFGRVIRANHPTGRIVHFLRAAEHDNLAELAAYRAGLAAVRAMTVSAAIELSPAGILVAAVDVDPDLTMDALLDQVTGVFHAR